MKKTTLFLLALALARCCLATALEKELALTINRTPHPTNAAEFTVTSHLPGINQRNTLVCWSFATASFFESEMTRLKKTPVRLSVFYPVYCAYLEKARRFVATRGNSRFSVGDLFTGSFDVCREYGALPASLYDQQQEAKLDDQRLLYDELDALMNNTKEQGNWNEGRVLAQAKKILDRWLGTPPQKFSWDGKARTPKSFLADIIQLPWPDYVILTSLESAPFNTYTELRVPDNWRHHTNFFNVPLPVFYQTIKDSLQNGFSLAADIDNSELSYNTTARYCMILDADIPNQLINQDAREIRILNGATSDDHLIHLVGFKTFSGEDWFLAKDSWKKAWHNGNRGYVFLHGPYVKLKLLSFVVHRDAVPQIKELRRVP